LSFSNSLEFAPHTHTQLKKFKLHTNNKQLKYKQLTSIN